MARIVHNDNPGPGRRAYVLHACVRAEFALMIGRRSEPAREISDDDVAMKRLSADHREWVRAYARGDDIGMGSLAEFVERRCGVYDREWRSTDGDVRTVRWRTAEPIERSTPPAVVDLASRSGMGSRLAMSTRRRTPTPSPELTQDRVWTRRSGAG